MTTEAQFQIEEVASNMEAFEAGVQDAKGRQVGTVVWVIQCRATRLSDGASSRWFPTAVPATLREAAVVGVPFTFYKVQSCATRGRVVFGSSSRQKPYASLAEAEAERARMGRAAIRRNQKSFGKKV